MPSSLTEAIGTAMTVVRLRWANNIRYMSAAALQRHLLERKAQYGIKGDLLTGSSELLLEAAEQIVLLGELKWR